MRSFSENAKKLSVEMIDASTHLKELNEALSLYYRQMTDTWLGAQKKINEKVPSIPKDVEQFEAYKRIWIDVMDNDFTDLFDSEKFGTNYGRLVRHEMELTKRWNNAADVLLKSANLPTKEEIDEVYKQMYSLKRRVSELESEVIFKGRPRAAGGAKDDGAAGDPAAAGTAAPKEGPAPKGAAAAKGGRKTKPTRRTGKTSSRAAKKAAGTTGRRSE